MNNCSENKETNSKRLSSAVTGIFEWIELFAVSFTVVFLIITFIARHSPVVGSSMVPTLEENDVLIISDLLYTPKQGDIIVAQSKPLGFDEPIIKRVIATEGQEVTIDYFNWKVTVDGITLEEDYINYILGKIMNPSNYLPETFTVPDDTLFVMGDNRNGSLDSRSSDVGFIDERYVVGKANFRIFPLSKFGSLYN